jgi:hypothetical protein
MEPYQERVVAEKKELDDRLSKLVAFIGGTVFLALPAAEQIRLADQSHAMQQYSDILGQRIAAFK